MKRYSHLAALLGASILVSPAFAYTPGPNVFYASQAGTTEAGLLAADAYCAAKTITCILDANYVTTADRILSANWQISGGKITRSTHALTFNGTFSAPDTRVFDVSGSGAITFAATQGPIKTAWFTKPDAVLVKSSSVTISSGSANLQVTGAGFTSADQGKNITVRGAGTAGGALITTISSITDATHVVLAANASTSLSAVASNVRYGTDNGAAINAALNAAYNSVGGGYVECTNGNYGFAANISVPNQIGWRPDNCILTELANVSFQVRKSGVTPNSVFGEAAPFATNRYATIDGLYVDCAEVGDVGIYVGVVVDRVVRNSSSYNCLKYNWVIAGANNDHFDNIASFNSLTTPLADLYLVNGVDGNVFTNPYGSKASVAHILTALDCSYDGTCSGGGSHAGFRNTFVHPLYELGTPTYGMECNNNFSYNAFFNAEIGNGSTTAIANCDSTSTNDEVYGGTFNLNNTTPAGFQLAGSGWRFYAPNFIGIGAVSAGTHALIEYAGQTSVFGWGQTSYNPNILCKNNTGGNAAQYFRIYLNESGFAHASIPTFPTDCGMVGPFLDTDNLNMGYYYGGSSLALSPRAYFGTASLTPTSIAAATCSSAFNITVTGAATGDFVTISPPSGSAMNGAFIDNLSVNSSNNVTFKLCSPADGGTITPPTGTWQAMVTKRLGT